MGQILWPTHFWKYKGTKGITLSCTKIIRVLCHCQTMNVALEAKEDITSIYAIISSLTILNEMTCL